MISANAASVTSITYTDGASDDATASEENGSYTVPAASTHDVEFTVAYGNNAESGFIEVTIEDGTSGCDNTIQYHITVMPPPTYTLTIAATSSTDFCQVGSGAGDEAADVKGTGIAAEENTVTYTVTPVISNIITGVEFDYTFDFTLPASTTIITDLNSTSTGVTAYPNGTILVENVTGEGSGAQTGVSPVSFDVTFTSVVGESTQALEAAIVDWASTATLTIDDGSNSGAGTVVNATIASGGSATATVNALAVPNMGSF